MALLRVGPLPEEPLAAAGWFHAEVLPRVRAALVAGGDLVLVFGPADHTHRDWRIGAVRGLAREHAPARVNAVASGDEVAIAATVRYLDRAPGVTGQLLPLDGTGAGAVLYGDA
jgi:hypothetical protein